MNLGGVIRLNKSGICLLTGAMIILFIYALSTRSDSNTRPTVKINLKNLLNIAINAAENGGVEVVSNKDKLRVQNKGLTKEGANDSVTNADFLSHCVMIATLKHAYPSLNVISEETKVRCDSNQAVDISDRLVDISDNVADEWRNIKDITVWIDPLDATQEYTEKLYDYVTTMVCVAVNGKPVIGVIHKPFTKSKVNGTFWAWTNKAKSYNLRTEKRKDDKLKIIVSRSHRGEIERVIKQNVKESNIDIITAAGAGYKALEVASGNADAYLHITDIKKWDICAGNAIVEAMGGKMTTKFGERINYKDAVNVVNQRGLVATLKNQDLFIYKI